jgi:hypothetical protein
VGSNLTLGERYARCFRCLALSLILAVYCSVVFGYQVSVIAYMVKIGRTPAMQQLLVLLFVISTNHFVCYCAICYYNIYGNSNACDMHCYVGIGGFSIDILDPD